MNLPAAGWFFLVTWLLSVSFGLLALWVGVRRKRWTSVLLILGLALFLRVPAYEPLLFFAIQCGVIVLGARLWRRPWNRDADPGGRFSLAGLFAIVALAAALLTVCIRIDLPSVSVWLNLVGGGVACGIATLVGAWALVTPWRWRRLLIAIPLLLVSTLPMVFTDSILLQFPSYQWRDSDKGQMIIPTYFPYGPNASVWGSMLLSIVMSVFVVCWVWLGAISESVCSRRICRIALPATLASLFGASLLVGFAVPSIPSSGEEQIANNGYPLIREAIEEIGITPLPKLKPQQKQFSDQQIATHLRQNSAVLAKFHEALSRPIQLPLEPFDNSGKAPWRYVQAKMHPLLNYELNELSREQRHTEAIVLSQQMLEFSQKVATRGYLVYALVGKRFQASALKYWTLSRHELDEAQLTQIVQSLQENDAAYESYDAALQRRYDCSALTFGWTVALARLLPKSAEASERARIMRLAWYRFQAFGRLLALDIRIREYEKEHGELPLKIDVLELPNEMLLDPYGNGLQQLVYRKDTRSKFVLYSRGMDLKDDGGLRAELSGSWNDNLTDGDWFLDDVAKY